jgi:predicted phage-related endonuclease
MVQLSPQFWQYVTSDTLPPVDGTESADRALRALYPEDNLQTLDFSTDSRMSAMFADWQSVKQTLSDHEKVEAKLKQTLQKAMGEASYAHFETGVVSWKKSKDSLSLDTAKLQQDFPELLAQYQTTKPGSRRFIVV